MPDPSAVIVVFVVFVLLIKTLMIVPEGQVVVVYVLGKFHGSYGPGFHMGLFGRPVAQKLRLKIGTIGTATSENTIEIGPYQLEAKFSEKTIIGSKVRIVNFDDVTPLVSSVGVSNENVVRCEKCGHQMTIRV